MLSTDYFQNLLNFFDALIFSKEADSIFFGLFDSWQSVLLNLADIFVSAFCFYFILKLFRQSRAWQLFKGVIFLFAFAVLCNFFGLKTISYLLYNSMSILLIGFVVIFQPELRKALETLGRNTFVLLRSAAQDLNYNSSKASDEAHMINRLVEACQNMSRTKTGALIIIERTTGLKEIIDASSTAVILDSLLTVPALEQIFYKNSPLHDGALILRNGKIYAARCHVPLSENTSLKGDLGTRHRAALGASELGDSIVVVVSEETGTMSVAQEGVLYRMDNIQMLEETLKRLLLPTESKPLTKQNFLEKLKAIATVQKTETKQDVQPETKFTFSLEDGRRFLSRLMTQVGLQLLSLIFAIFLFLYVQTTTNPVETYTLTQVNINKNFATLYEEEGYTVQLQNTNLSVTVRARASVVQRLQNQLDIISAYVDLPTNQLKEGTYTLPVSIKSEVLSDRLYQIQKQSVNSVVATVLKQENKENEILPGLEENIYEIHKTSKP